jgi:hypothetical protein
MTRNFQTKGKEGAVTMTDNETSILIDRPLKLEVKGER